jgi:large subunit ribosomal protein L10
MAITKDKKKEILEKLNDVTTQESVVFVNFHGLPVSETTELRKELREKEVSYFVAKKSLVRKAFGDSKISGDLPELDGELAVAYASDPTAAAREIYSFQKKFEDNIQILGGVFEEKFLNKSEMEEIALIPSIDVLRGMFVNVINSPIQGFAMAIKAIADSKEA